MNKVLITGANQNQCNRKFYLRQQLKVVPSHYSLFNCLYDMDFEVEQREVLVGEDLSKYKYVFAYIAGPRQLVTTKLFNLLWVVYNRPDCILLSDDWQIQELYSSLMKHDNEKELSSDFILNTNKVSRNFVKDNMNFFLLGIERIISMKNKMLISAFSSSHLDSKHYGIHLLFDSIKYPIENLYSYNPNPYHRNRKPGDIHDEGDEDPFYKKRFTLDEFIDSEEITIKRKQFNFASLVQSKTKKWLKNEGFIFNENSDETGTIGSWKTELYGSRSDSQKRLSEDLMCRVFEKDWACLMPGYDHAGSGWWRARPLQVADAGSILIGVKKEMEVFYGKDFKYNTLKAKDITELSESELKSIAASQREAIYRLHPLNKDKQKEEISKVL